MLDASMKAPDDPSPTRLFVIYNAVKLFGSKPYKGKPNPVDSPVILTQAEDAIEAVFPNAVKTPLKALGQQMLPPPEKPESLEGSPKPVTE